MTTEHKLEVSNVA